MPSESRKPEPDVDDDPVEGQEREAGGVEDPEAPDQASATGTTPNEEYVGRVSGADPGYVGETGAERRAQAAKEGDDG